MLAHPALEAGEEALELVKAARQQIVYVAGLWDSRSKVVGREIGIALDDRDPVDDVAEHTGGTHACQAAANHEGTGGGMIGKPRSCGHNISSRVNDVRYTPVHR